ncbi:thioredoxin-like 1-1, chloroplastic [Cucurbita pepo subsp. pepo]|uniref:thioredoxin-like 1-1, chloroplastic n=1 Tax=Cucurbita pepo subsp. pepo TaxID=3664 RepID=UPI000C9D99A9|nr:thioredoxin-like 1-1, chloroplastic [Cucurbita pepo subsp. pepo]
MACSLKTGLSVSGLKDHLCYSNSSGVSGFSTSVCASSLKVSKQPGFPVLSVDFLGNPVVISDRNGIRNSNAKAPNRLTVYAQASICVSRARRWWEKTLKPNMVEIHSAQALVDALLDAGDRLAIIDFYSPGCGGCKALHPKICQLAELNPDAIFLKVNFEELKTMCQALHIRVLPFFRFYRGGEGRVCSFSCTNATIKKFKDALAEHGSDRSSILPAKGLDESELERLAMAGELSSSYLKERTLKGVAMKEMDCYGSWGTSGNKMEVMEENNMILKV